MIKLSSIKRLFTSILLVAFGTSNVIAQQVDHELGTIVVQLKEDTKIENLVKAVQGFQHQENPIQSFKHVSEPFHVWSLKFNHNRINELDFLSFIRQHPLIENAQFNFWLEERTPPNDPFYLFQHALNNFGQNGGTPGVDLDAEIAWETTTGGTTLNGDNIVLCIIDEDFDINHEDLNENLWINHDEIPGNNYDDDYNGFVDDYYGWNVVDSTDDVGNNNNPGNHGTQVAGIAGAVGNNNKGISGVNWNVKLMFVTRGYSVEHAIAAYTFPFKFRKKYNETNGNKGAFVVATNSSWGVNYGTPDEEPLWCAIYDSLGSVGILSAAATANLAIDVDEAGDLPTTCISDFLVTTTKVSNTDALLPNAGYGATSIDLAAFGKNIFTTKPNNNYGLLGGTSAAAPQLAGAIALLYSAPCPSFINYAKSQPQSASLLVKDYILNGTEPNPNLENITVTGGRLNVANSLQLLMDDCNYTGCYPPFSIEIDEITDESAQIYWLTGTSTFAVKLRYRVVGEPDWIVINDISTPFEFTNLSPCTNYEFQLSSECGSITSDYSLNYEFETIGCCDAPTMFDASSISETQVLLQWDEMPFADLYNIRYREVGASNWTIISITDFDVTVPDLNSCTNYEFQIRSQCSSGQNSDYSESLLVYTLGCSNCTELSYCEASANDQSFAWIKKVDVSNLDYTSGNSINGYTDHTDQSVDLLQGQSYEMNLQSESSLGSFPGIFNVWIDFDQNGFFNDLNELILHSNNPETNTTKSIYIPMSALSGSTRMRVAFLEQHFGPCGTSILVGEIEDYCVNIEESTECLPPVSINFNAFENGVGINWLGNLYTESYLIKYKEVVDTTWNSLSTYNTQIAINDLNKCTDYEFIIHAVCNGEPSLPTEHFYFTTKGCGACLDYDYCSTNPADASFEWIERVQISTLDNSSASNDGFAYFPDHSTNLTLGGYYPLVITPGFSNFPFDEHYSVWIDFDQDGFFNSNEIIFDSSPPYNQNAEGIILIPLTAQTGSTKMRIIMKYLLPPDSPCDYDFDGEIEEYCINIVENQNQVCNQPENLAANSITQFSTIITWEAVNDAVSYTLRYQRSDTTNAWKYITNYNNSFLLYGLEECTAYQVQTRTNCEFGLSVFSESVEFETSCISTTTTEEQNINSISLFPNPAQENFFVAYHLNTQTELQFELYDLSGKLLLIKNARATFGEQQTKIQFPKGCADGIYYLKIKTKNQPPTILKVVKTN